MTRLSDKIVRDLQSASDGRQLRVYDGSTRGFGIRVTPAGQKAFFLNYVIHGRERRITIGSYPAWSVSAAREEARVLRRRVDQGDDPLAAREEMRTRKTLSDVFARYDCEVMPRKAAKTIATERSMWRRLILPRLGRSYVADIRPEDIDALHAGVSICTRVQANRCVASVRHVMSYARRWGYVTANPVVGVHLNTEQPRERYLTDDELDRFMTALRQRPATPAVLAIEFILLTGCRRGEALQATWSQFDLDAGVWSKPSAHTKQRRAHRVPLSTGAVDVLRRAKLQNSSEYVFQGQKAGTPLVEIKKAFKTVREIAGMADFRIHDLRHSYASFLASDGVAIATIGRLLGHTQIATTSRYTHLLDTPLRTATEGASQRVLGAHHD